MFEQIIQTKNTDNVPMVLVGNKSDLEDQRAVTTEEGKRLAIEMNSSFIETSAMQNINVSEVNFLVSN
jgi:GTPase KRas